MNNDVVKAFIRYLRKEGFDNIQANLDGYTPPDEVKAPDQKVSLVPNLTANSGVKLYLFEFEDLKYDIETQLISRWKLLSDHALDRNGEFFLVVEAERGEIIKTVLEENKIDGVILPIELN